MIRTARPFRYHVRRRNSGRSGPGPGTAFAILLALIGSMFLPNLVDWHRGQPRNEDARPQVPETPQRTEREREKEPPATDLRYESWTPPKPATRQPNDRDLAELQAWMDETDAKMYDGTFPKIKIQWTNDYGNAYAYAYGEEIRFVRSKFYPDWIGNRDVVLHEMAHVATLGHDHDILWDQERGRLAEGRRVMTLAQVRAASR